MPMPMPMGDEDHDEFMERCMGDETMQGDFDDPTQRAAVCEAQWGKRKKRMKQKVYKAALRLKAEGEGEAGEFSAVFSTLSVEDLHRDVTLPGAFTNGQPVIIEPWNHGWTLPVGKAVIRSDEKEAWVEGKFFLDTIGGLDHYRTVKNLEGIAEWSYTFDVLEADRGQFNGRDVQFLRKLDVVGVGPVTRGAGIDTRTVGIKQADGKEPPRENEKKEPESGEGETPNESKPSGVVRITRTRIDLIELED